MREVGHNKQEDADQEQTADYSRAYIPRRIERAFNLGEALGKLLVGFGLCRYQRPLAQ